MRIYWDDIEYILISLIDFTKTFKQIVGWLSSARKKEEGDENFQMYFKSGAL